MAIACLGFLTFRPLLPERSSLCLNSCMTRSTVSFCGLLSCGIVVILFADLAPHDVSLEAIFRLAKAAPRKRTRLEPFGSSRRRGRPHSCRQTCALGSKPCRFVYTGD